MDAPAGAGDAGVPDAERQRQVAVRRSATTQPRLKTSVQVQLEDTNAAEG